MKIAQVSDKTLKEEGERMVPAFHKGALVYGEHLTRYESILDIIKGKKVLDIASGSGYGSFILAASASEVIGVDIDKDSVEYAKRNYAKSNIKYVVGSAEKIPLEDASVDAVVTFETIEHVKDYRKFLREVKRVIKPGGLAIISTPNDPEFPEGNHFHLHEFKEKELESVIREFFNNVEFSYQYTWVYTAMLSDSEAEKEWKKDVETDNYAPVAREKALYFMVVCSDKTLKGVPKVKQLAAISEHYSARRLQEASLRRESEFKSELKSRDSEIKSIRVQLESREKEIQAIYISRGWRLLRFIYSLRDKLAKPFTRK